MIRRIIKRAVAAPTHNRTAAISAAKEKAGEVSRNFQYSANIEISTHENATNTSLCSWTAYVLSRAVVNNTKMPNQHSQDATPRNSDDGFGHRTIRAIANPTETIPSTRSQASFRLPTSFDGPRCLSSAEAIVRSSPLDFRQRISALSARNIMHPELKVKA
jgi:hypothetical protein